MRRIGLLFALLLAASQNVAGQDWVVSWDWKMPYRIRSEYVFPPGSDFNYLKPTDLRPTGVDTNGDGLNDCFAFGQGCDAELAAIVNGIKPPEGWKVEFTVTDEDVASGQHTYTWDIPGGIPVEFDPATRTGHAYFPQEGRYRVTLTVTDGSAVVSLPQDVVVQDWLIVAMGDSYISGEGNPDIDGDALDGLRPPVWADRRCHRSTYSWPALVARAIEDADPHSSVTLLHLGCGGSLASDGMYGPYEGTEPLSEKIPAQLVQVRTLIGDREIDALLLSTGGNDIGFGNIVKSCIFQGDCETDHATVWIERDMLCETLFGWTPLAGLCKIEMPTIGPTPSAKQLFDSLYYGDPRVVGVIPPPTEASLAAKYAYLGPEIAKLNLVDPTGVYMLDYPAATNDEHGQVCGSETHPFDMIPGFVSSEVSWAATYAQGFLKERVERLVGDNLWNLISFGDLFNTHGYCAVPELPEPDGDGAWFVRLGNSLIREVAMEGTLHPNYRAHYEIAEALETTLMSHFWNDGRPANGVKRQPTQPGTVIQIDSSYAVDEGGSVTLRNDSYNFDGTEPAFSWSLGGGCAENGAATLDSTTARSPVLTAVNNCTGQIVLGDPAAPDGTIHLTINNLDPKMVSLEAAKSAEGGTATLTFEFKDAGVLDTHTAWIDWGDGTVEELGKPTPLQLLTATHAYADNGTYPVGVSVEDGDGGLVKEETPVEVANVPPSVGAISGSASGIPVDTAIVLGSSFTDAGIADTHTARWDWGDGTTTTGTVTEARGSGSVAGTHAYSSAGIYTVRLSVTDKDGATAWAAPVSAVIYDPAAGSVSGAGLLSTPPDGPLVYAMSVQYRRDGTVPSGRFQFEAPGRQIRLSAASFLWLVVDGPMVWFTGSGEVNGTSGHLFTVSAVDGAGLTPAGADRLRVKIWNPAGQVLYDSEPGAPDLSVPALAVASGSVVVR